VDAEREAIRALKVGLLLRFYRSYVRTWAEVALAPQPQRLQRG